MMISTTAGLSLSKLLPCGGISITKTPAQSFRLCDGVIVQAAQYIHQVEMCSGKVYEARKYLEAAKARAKEGAVIAALAAARMAICLAKAALPEKGREALHREGDSLLIFVDLAVDACRKAEIFNNST